MAAHWASLNNPNTPVIVQTGRLVEVDGYGYMEMVPESELDDQGNYVPPPLPPPPTAAELAEREKLRRHSERLFLETFFSHGSINHLIENIHAECELCGALDRFHQLLAAHLQGKRAVSRWNIEWLEHGFDLGFDFDRNPESAMQPDEDRFTAAPPSFPTDAFNASFLHPLDDDDYPHDEIPFTLKDHYAHCFRHCTSALPERVQIRPWDPVLHFRTMLPGEPPLDSPRLLSQHCFLDFGNAPGTAAPEAAIDTIFNGTVRDVRRILHWPRFRLLLLAQRSGDEHGGLERLSSDLIAAIGHHMLNGTKDAHGFEVAGSFDMPFEDRPGYEEMENDLEFFGIMSDERRAERDEMIQRVQELVQRTSTDAAPPPPRGTGGGSLFGSGATEAEALAATEALQGYDLAGPV